MTIYIGELRSPPEFFSSLHLIAYPIGGESYTIVRSGIVVLPNESQTEAEAAGRTWTASGFEGTSQSDWRRETVSLQLDLSQSIARLNPGPPDAGNYWGFAIDQWAPIACLNSIYNGGVSNYAGSAVRTFKVYQTADISVVNLDMDIAVRDTDGYLYRIGFYVTLVGHLVQQAPPG